MAATPARPGAGVAPDSPSIVTWTNGQQIPASFANQLFGAKGPLFARLPANPQLDPRSAQYIADYYTSELPFNMGKEDPTTASRQYDINDPVYVAKTTDPLVKLNCTAGYSPYGCGFQGQSVHIPANAAPAGGADTHMDVIDPTHTYGYDLDAVATNPPYTSGETVNVNWGTIISLSGTPLSSQRYCYPHCPDVAPGFATSESTAGNVSGLSRGVLISELQQGVIKHAIYLAAACTNGTHVYPATNDNPGEICNGGLGVPLGARVWYDLTPRQIDALDLLRDEKTELIALHEYGGYILDTSSPANPAGYSFFALLENQEPYWRFGAGSGNDPAWRYAMAQNWPAVGPGGARSLIMSGSVIDFQHHLHVVAPCVTQRIC